MSGDDLVTRPPDYYQPGSVVEYAPGYRIFANDGFTLSAKYDDASLETARRMTLTDPKKAYEQQSLLYAAGYLKNSADVGFMWGGSVQSAYARAMSDANANYMSLNDFLKMRAAALAAGGGGRGSGGGPSSSTNVSRSVRLTSRPTAEALMKQALAQELGREPNSAEVDRFLRALNKSERANPTVTTTTSRSDGKGHSSSSSTTKESSIDPSTEAESFAEKVDPKEAHRYQTGQFYDVISRMVGI